MTTPRSDGRKHTRKARWAVQIGKKQAQTGVVYLRDGNNVHAKAAAGWIARSAARCQECGGAGLFTSWSERTIHLILSSLGEMRYSSRR
jgi:hypothetical protein